MLKDRLEVIRTEKGMTKKEVANLLRIDQSTYGKYELGKREPDYDTVCKLADLFKVSVDWILGRTNLRYLPTNAILIGETTTVPVIGVIRAGEPILVAENIVGYETIEKSAVKNGEYFFLRVAGDSMTGARIRDGDLVLVRRQEDVDDGQIAVVLIGSEEATLKKVYRQNGQVILQAENPDYPPRIISRGDLRILGKVVEVKFKLE